VYNLCLELDDGKMLVIISIFAAEGLCILSSVGVFVFHLYMRVHAHVCLFNCFGTGKEARRVQRKESIESTVLCYMFKSRSNCLKCASPL